MSNWLPVVGMLMGAVIGLKFPELATELAFLGEFYLSLLKMCVLPIVIATVLTGFTKLLRSKHTGMLISKMAAVFLGGLTFCAFFGLSLGKSISSKILSNPEVKASLADLVSHSEIPVATEQSFSQFLLKLIPENIFKALTEGNLIPILIAVILLGIALGKSKNPQGSGLIEGLEELREAFLLIMSWFMVLLPLGVLGIFAGTFSQLKSGIFQILMHLIAYLLAGALVLAIINLWIYSRLRAQSLLKSIRELKSPILIGLGTSSSLAALPQSLRVMKDHLSLPEWYSGLVFPMSVTFNSHALVYFNTFITVFICSIYAVPMTLKAVLLIWIGSIFRAWSSSGMPATASLLGMAVIFQPLGVPFESFIGLLLVILPIVDPVMTAFNLIAHFMATTLIARIEKLN